MDREKLKSVLVLLPVFILMGIASYYLYLDLEPPIESTETAMSNEVIGMMVYQNSNVKRKTEKSLYWNSTADNDKLFVNDSIRTGGDGRAIIELSDKSQIELSENSLIVLEKNANQLNIDFKTGDIETRAQNLKIKVKDTVLDSKNAELKLKTDSKNNTQIVVTKGSAILTDSKNQKLELDGKNGLQVDEKGQTKKIAIALLLNSPKNKATLLEPERTSQVPFTWTVLDENIKVETLEISDTDKFSVVRQKKEAHQATTVSLPRGKYFWRVSWTNTQNQKQFSEIHEFRIEEDKRILPTAPLNQSTLSLEPGQTDVNFSWTTLNENKVYALEIAKDTDFKNLAFNKTTEKKSLDVTGLKEGSYYWRVKTFNENNSETGRSSHWQFVIKRSLPQLPILTAPQNGFVWSLNDPLLFEWKAESSFNTYLLTVSRDANQKDIVNQIKSEKNNFLWKWTKPEEYYWSVKGISDNGDIVSQSLIQKITIKPTVVGPLIQLKGPENQINVSRDQRDPIDPVVFEWADDLPQSTGSYTLVISEKPDFTDAVLFRCLTTKKYSHRFTNEGNYYWRVLWLKHNNDKCDETSGPLKFDEQSLPYVFKFRLNSNLLAPLLIEPINGIVKSVGKQESLELRWKPSNGAVKYRVTLERELINSTDRTPVISEVTSSLFHKTPALDPGTYYWTVNSIDSKNIEGAPATPRRFTIDLNKELSAPKLKPPIVK